MNKIQFGASWEKKLSTISSLVTVILILVALETVGKASRFDSETIALRIGLAALIVLNSIFCLIRGYSITPDTIEINHIGRAKKFKIRDITDIEKVPLGARNGFGLCGIWGIYSFTGIAINSTYGIHKRYLTNRSNAVALKFGKKTVVVSPDDPDRFIQEVQGKIAYSSEPTRQPPIDKV